MSTRAKITWLEEDGDRLRLFMYIASCGAVGIRKLREQLGASDWWPVKCHVESLIEHGLIAKNDDSYQLTEEGQKVHEARKAVSYLEGLK